MKASTAHKQFNKRAEKVVFDKEHRSKINFNISKYDAAVNVGKSIFRDEDVVRTRAANIRYKVINELDKHLIEFEDNFIKNGGIKSVITEAFKLADKKFGTKITMEYED